MSNNIKEIKKYPLIWLVSFKKFLKSIGIKLNNAGGEIKISSNHLLRQSSTVA